MNYRILWKTTEFGESQVEAKSKKEARKFADEGHDHSFDRLDSNCDWTVHSIEKIEE